MSWFSDIFIPSTSQTSAEQEANYARQQAEYQRRLEERGLTTGAEPHYVPPALEDQDAAAAEGFLEGAGSGVANVLAFPGRAVAAVGVPIARGVASNIPWWLWLGAVAALFIYMGGLGLLRGKLGKFA